MITIRGAITIDNNRESEIIDATKSLLSKMMSDNGIGISDIIFIMFTATKDIDKAYPAVGARQLGITQASLICTQEMYVEGSLPKCIRAMMAVNMPGQEGGHFYNDSSSVTGSNPKHVYMKNAQSLRPDIGIYSVAIDGPTASGKSTIAKEVAKKLNIGYADTGAMYRAVALYYVRNNVDLNDGEKIASMLGGINLTIKYEKGIQYVLLSGEDVTEAIRTPEVANASSKIALISEVREKLTEFQRTLAKRRSMVMDGRDIGTVVMPDSVAKFFITASVDERCKRRCIDFERKGIPISFETVKNQIIERDCHDTTRGISPLVKADDAYEIDTTDMGPEEVVDKIVGIVSERRNERLANG